MKRYYIGFILLVITSLMLSGSVIAQQEGDTYTGADGQYTIPVPQEWTVEEQEQYAVIQGPDDEDIRVYVLVTSLQESLQTTIENAWSVVDPEFDREIGQTANPPTQSGVDESLVIQYQAGERLVQAVAQRVGDTVFTLLIDADLVAAQRRSAQLNTVASGFNIQSVQERDLSDAEPQALSDEMVAEIETYISDNLSRFNVPGAAVAIVQNGEIVYTGGFGVTEVGGDQPITADTHMMIGSTGKSITTAMMAAMVDEGLFAWDTPVIDVLPEFEFANPELTQQITMQNLVCACSGVPRRDLELFFNAESLTAEAVVESLATFELFTDFGETFQYSNQMVATGGYAAAAADSADFGRLYDGYIDSVTSRILEPTGMSNTTLSFDVVRERDNYAQPHGLDFAFSYSPIPLEQELFVQPVAPAGGHWSTANDMARYMVMQLNTGITQEGERIVSEENLLQTREPQVGVSAETDYGLGWFVDDYEGVELIQHGGNTVGFSSSFGFLPDKDIGVLVLMNAQASNAFGNEVRNYVFDRAFGIYDEERDQQELEFAVNQIRNATERPDGLQESADAEQVREFTGTYNNDSLGEITVSLEDNRLLLDTGVFEVELLPVLNNDGDVDRYIFDEPPLRGFPAEFQQQDGEMQLIIGQGTQEYTFIHAE